MSLRGTHGGRRPGAGRPPPAGARRVHRLALVLSDAELAELTAASGEAPLSTWLREAGLAAARGSRDPP